MKVNKNEYLHEGGWQNVGNPLHEQEFVQNEMHSFHLDQECLEHRQCTICKKSLADTAELEIRNTYILPVRKRQEITKEIQC